jgi:DNA-binding SARP family transcriptional activator
VEFRILGSVEVCEEGCVLPVGGKQRALLALLLLEPRQVLSRERLVDELWGDDPPETAAKAVQVFVGRLRKALPTVPLVTRGSAYMLDVDRSQIDRDRFEDRVGQAREAAAEGAPERASELLREALELWRGPALADVDEPFARAARAVLEEQRLGALEDRIEADLALGRHRQLVHELEALVGEHPLRERVRAQLMLALYRSGRQAEALQAYADARRTLVDELGLEPSRELHRLQQHILAHDPSLDVAARPSPASPSAGRSPRRRRLLAMAVLAATGAAVASASLVNRTGGAAISLVPRSVARVNAHSGRLTMQVPLGATPLFLAGDATGTWAATQEGTVVHLDAAHGHVDTTATIGFTPSDLAATDDGAWVGDRLGPLVARVSRRYERVVARVALPRPSDRVAAIGPVAPRLVAADGSLWIAAGQTTVIRVDPRTNRIRQTITPRTGASGAIAFGAGAVWVGGANAVARISPASGVVVAVVHLDATPAAIAIDHGSLWAALSGTATVARVDGYADTPIATVSVGAQPTAIAAAAGAVWVIAGKELLRISGITNSITRRIRLRGRASALAASRGDVWIASA